METYFVNWYGPFTHDEVNRLYDKNNLYEGFSGNGLYAWTGKVKRQRNNACLKYIGITSVTFWERFAAKDHKHWNINRDKYVWLGKVQNKKSTKVDLEAAEYLLISYCAPILNDQKTDTLPPFSCTVISKFFKKDKTAYQRVPSIIRPIPDVVIWNHESEKLSDGTLRTY